MRIFAITIITLDDATLKFIFKIASAKILPYYYISTSKLYITVPILRQRSIRSRLA